MSERPGVLISGGAGFIGSWLCERMVAEGWRVLCVDNLVTGSRANVAGLEALGPARFAFFEEDICDAPSAALSAALGEGLRLIMNLACPASPIFYARLPLLTMRTGSAGTWNLLELARAHGARFLMASTSEVYGDPLVHPQTEDYTGNVNPIGPRSVYDESKRFSESLVAAYQREFHLEARIARIFNTYGPRMQINDGRVVSNFVCQALRGEGLTVYGDGSQTRSFCYVEDTVEGLLRLAASEFSEPVNIGNPDEHTIGEFAALVMEMTGARGALVTAPLPADDPRVRRPDIRRAREVLGWSPQIPLREGLARTIAWFGERLDVGAPREAPDALQAAREAARRLGLDSLAVRLGAPGASSPRHSSPHLADLEDDLIAAWVRCSAAITAEQQPPGVASQCRTVRGSLAVAWGALCQAKRAAGEQEGA